MKALLSLSKKKKKNLLGITRFATWVPNLFLFYYHIISYKLLHNIADKGHSHFHKSEVDCVDNLSSYV